MTRIPADDPGTGDGLPAVEVWTSRNAVVGDTPVRRALPRSGRRTVGAWCFADHMGPLPPEATPTGIGPHPHSGLHTVTWLVQGELLHRDSIGSEQPIRPGQLNLMSAGHGVSHAEEPTGRRGRGLHGIQLWVAQPEATRHGEPAFEHHPYLPEVEVGTALATVLVGTLDGVDSPARRDTDLVGLDVRLRPGVSELPVASTFEHAVVVLEGVVRIDGRTVAPGQGAFAGPGRHQLDLATGEETRLLVLGGVPFESPVVMWWNFVGRSRREVAEAGNQWNAGAGRFGETGSSLARIPAPLPPWAAVEA
jgi:redox-sensitive bicupin YhaK (pirin superfamily)